MSTENLKDLNLKEMILYMRDHFMKKTARFLYSDEEQKVAGSRIGGIPYFKEGMSYPQSDTGEDLSFLLQIRLEDLNGELSELPACGILQFYINCKDEILGAESKTGFKVVFVKDIDETVTFESALNALLSLGKDPDLIDAGKGEFSPLTGSSALRCKTGFSLPSVNDDFYFGESCKEAAAAQGIIIEGNAFLSVLNIVDESDAYDELVRLIREAEQKEEDELYAPVQLLGYPDFTQSNPIWDKDYILLMKAESYGNNKNKDQRCEMMWGDCGIANFFIRKEDLNKSDFSHVKFYWDCC